jgi:hypothetical protein
MKIVFRNWTYELYVNGLLYAVYETRAKALEGWAEYRRNLRYGVAI